MSQGPYPENLIGLNNLNNFKQSMSHQIFWLIKTALEHINRTASLGTTSNKKKRHFQPNIFLSLGSFIFIYEQN